MMNSISQSSQQLCEKIHEEDRLSSLPNDVIQSILIRLRLRDAVRTSILSRDWRHKWNHLPVLEFNYSGFPLPIDFFTRRSEYDAKVGNIVDDVLLLHRGPIHKFTFSLPISSIMFRWIHFVSRNGIREFTLNNDDTQQKYVIPSCVLSCEDITSLDLCFCTVIPPASFNGFRNLRTLRLCRCSFSNNGLEKLISNSPLLESLFLCDIDDVPSCLFSCEEITHLELIRCTLTPPASFNGLKNLRRLMLRELSFSNNRLENLISNSPLLESLELCDIDDCTHLKLSAPNLVDLRVYGKFGDLYFEKTPVLAKVDIRLRKSEGFENLVNGCLPSIKKLELLDDTYQILSAAYNVPVWLPIPCPLLHLSLTIDLADTQEMLTALFIFRISTLLQKVGIECTTHGNGKEISLQNCWLWEAQEDFNMFSQLQILDVSEFCGTTCELKFIEFVLANAPVLEMIKIGMADESMTEENELLRNLSCFWRISSKAEIVIPKQAFPSHMSRLGMCDV